MTGLSTAVDQMRISAGILGVIALVFVVLAVSRNTKKASAKAVK